MPTAEEQYELELINDARLAPVGDAHQYLTGFDPISSADKDVETGLKYFGVDGKAFQSALSAYGSSQPLAFSDILAGTARQHDQAMIAANSQEHQLPGEPDPFERISAAGYLFSAAGENIFAYASSPLDAHAAFMIDWGPGVEGMQAGAGHRTNILDPDYREVGIGILNSSAGSVGPDVVTEDFGATRSAEAIILGVDYNDSDRNNFYSVGEGVSGLKISAGGNTAQSDDSGGYALHTPATGLQTVVLSGGGLQGDVSVQLHLSGAENVKLDIVDGHILRTSAPVDVTGPIDQIVGIGSNAGTSSLNENNAQGTLYTFQQDGSANEIDSFQLGSPATDKIDLSSFAHVNGFKQLMHLTHQVDGQAVITIGQTSITLDGLSKADLRGHADAFLFHE